MVATEKPDSDNFEPASLLLDKKTVDVLVANIIPTSKYFELRFDHMQEQIDGIKADIGSLRADMDKRFDSMRTDMDKRFDSMRTDMDKRFEQVDKRFEQVDKRFEQVDIKLDKIIERIDIRIDQGLRENRSQALRLFTFAMTFSAISMAGLLGKLLNVF